MLRAAVYLIRSGCGYGSASSGDLARPATPGDCLAGDDSGDGKFCDTWGGT